MKRQLENRTLCMAAVVISAIFLLSFLCSCGRRKVVMVKITETVHVTIKITKTTRYFDVDLGELKQKGSHGEG